VWETRAVRATARVADENFMFVSDARFWGRAKVVVGEQEVDRARAFESIA
jgi:hypothetical protein